MKTFLIIINLCFVCFSPQNINPPHRKINKFIKKTYKIDKFNLEEILITDSSLNGKFFKIKNNSNNSYIVYIGRVNSCRSNGCSIDNTSNSNSFEYFDYIIAFDERKKILNLKVFNYQATHGQEITAKSWLKQFRHKKNQKTFIVNKNIDAISGATISVYAITNNVNLVNEYLIEKLMK